jgi:hypothetical protein
MSCVDGRSGIDPSPELGRSGARRSPDRTPHGGPCSHSCLRFCRALFKRLHAGALDCQALGAAFRERPHLPGSCGPAQAFLAPAPPRLLVELRFRVRVENPYWYRASSRIWSRSKLLAVPGGCDDGRGGIAMWPPSRSTSVPRAIDSSRDETGSPKGHLGSKRLRNTLTT